MKGSAKGYSGECTFTVHIPLVVRKRGGRKLVLAPEGAPTLVRRARVDSAMVKALARAHRWKRMLETGEFATAKELAAAERINPSYLGRVLRLTLLAPDLAERILDGTQPPGLQLEQLFRLFPEEWQEQRRISRSREFVFSVFSKRPRGGLLGFLMQCPSKFPSQCTSERVGFLLALTKQTRADAIACAECAVLWRRISE
jgi:hypothetical protein